MKRKTPEGASFVEANEGAKLFAPSAARNLAPIASELAQIAPHRGKALEIASGTGQHIIAHAKAHPCILWQPSEINEDRIASINAYVAQAVLSNLAPAIELDATASGWGATVRYDLMLLSNLLHLISAHEAQTILTEAAQALSPKGRFMIYGPFMRGGVLTSEGDATSTPRSELKIQRSATRTMVGWTPPPKTLASCSIAKPKCPRTISPSPSRNPNFSCPKYPGESPLGLGATPQRKTGPKPRFT